MDTVQNIGGVIVGTGSGAPGAGGAPGGPQGAEVSSSAATAAQAVAQADPTSELVHYRNVGPRRSARQEFLSRPNWLFTHNENVLFCTALNALRFPDQNNVPRKFIEERLSDRMVTMETQWPAGRKFLIDTIAELERQDLKFEEKQRREIRQRQRVFYKNFQQAVKQAEITYNNASTAEQKEIAMAKLEEARHNASIPAEEIEVRAPGAEEIALEELQTKIVRRLQGQTDRLDMAEQLAGKPYVEPAAEYFQTVQDEILREIIEKHNEIAQEREKVDAKSKQSRRRRRNQVANGVTVSGSATRVRFTNREIAMLLHWIYSYQKTVWSSRIFEYYTEPGNARSAEHVRDKLRDLMAKSRDVEHGGLLSMKARAAGAYFAKSGEPEEVQQLAQHDLQDFKYPEGIVDFVPGGRYYDEERSAWVDGPIPAEYVTRYKEEIARIQRVVKSKVLRAQEKSLNLYDMRLVSSTAMLPSADGAYAAEADFAMATPKDLQDASNELTTFWDSSAAPKREGDKDGVSQQPDQQTAYDMTALASAALKPDAHAGYLDLVNSAQVEDASAARVDAGGKLKRASDEAEAAVKRARR